LNGVFLNITTGAHISVSTFKPQESINVLSINFFNSLLALRNEGEKVKEVDYNEWYEWNFKRTNVVIKNVERLLSQAFD
jgi:hypothetical protein